MIANSYKITLTSFLAYFVMSALISPLGIVSSPIAAHYDVSVTAATADFSYLTIGLLLGTVLSFFIFDVARLKTIIIGFSSSICLSLAGMYLVDLYALFPVWLFMIGIACGVNLTAAIIVISAIYTDNLRASMLLLTDSFYSIAGVVSTFLAGKFIADGRHWASAYLLAFVVSALIIVTAFRSLYPATARQKEAGPKYENTYWPPGLYLIGMAILIYLAGFVTIYSWIPNYAQAQFAVSAESAGTLVSRLFTGMFIGQLIMFWLVLKFSPTRVVFFSGTLAALLSVALWMVDIIARLGVSMIILGLVTGGMFKLIIAFGTMLVQEIRPKMISYLVFNSAVGTAIAPAVSAFIVEKYAMSTALQFASLCYCTMLILLYLAYISGRKNASAHTL